jgi:hypothetical protein
MKRLGAQVSSRGAITGGQPCSQSSLGGASFTCSPNGDCTASLEATQASRENIERCTAPCSQMSPSSTKLPWLRPRVCFSRALETALAAVSRRRVSYPGPCNQI